MIKKILINEQDVPVPVPICHLYDAVSWVEESLVLNGQILTRIILDEKEYLLEDFHNDWKKINLTKNSILSIQCDSPRDLAIRTLDAVRDLAQGMDKRLKFLAVKCWQIPENEHIQEILAIIGDIDLSLELVDHINGMIDFSHKDMAALNGVTVLLKKVREHLETAAKNEDWRLCSRILINRLDPLLKDLVSEAESVEIRVFSAIASDESIPSANLGLTRL